MGLFNSFFSRNGSAAPDREGRSSEPPGGSLSTASEEQNNLRRELVHVVLRDTMRAHAVPLDWLTAMVLPLSGRSARRAVHILLVVRQGHEQMLAYVPAFQRGFLATLGQVDSRASEWLMGLSWQFDGMPDRAGAPLPPLVASTAAAAATASAIGSAPAQGLVEDEELAEDLRALFAIRDEALRAESPAPAEPDFEPTQPLQ